MIVCRPSTLRLDRTLVLAHVVLITHPRDGTWIACSDDRRRSNSVEIDISITGEMIVLQSHDPRQRGACLHQDVLRVMMPESVSRITAG